MPNTLSLTVRDKDGTNIAAVFDALEQGLFSADAGVLELLGSSGTALLSAGAGTVELRIDYETIDGVVHATRLTLTEDGRTEWTGRFADPEPLGFSVWTDMRPLSFGDALLGDTRIDMRGGKGDDFVTGSEFGDRFRLGSGDDAANGGGGNDILQGGRGKDVLIGGAGDDTLNGGADTDMLIVGSGNDVANGGAGNDVLVFDAGQNVGVGGAGSDIFIFNSFDGSAGSNLDIQTRVRDFDSEDVLVFTEFNGSFPGDFVGETLADVENGTIDGFVWRETARGVEIQAGDAQVFLRGASADQIDLDLLLFTQQSTYETVTLFDSSQGGGQLGSGLNGDALISFGAEGSTFIAFGAEATTFIAFGAETTTFDTSFADF